MKTRTMLLPIVVMLALIGCDDADERPRKDDDQIRNTYNSVDDCKKDYKEEFCERYDDKYDDEDDDGNTVVVQHAYYHGPWYPYWIYHRQMVFYGGYPRTLGIMTRPSGGGRASFIPSSAISSSGGRVAISRGGFGSIGMGVSS